MHDSSIDSPVRRSRGKTRAGAETRAYVTPPSAPRKDSAATSRLSVTLPKKLIQDCRILAIREAVSFPDLVAQSLQATLNRRPRFQEYLKGVEELARAIALDPPEESGEGQAA